MSKLIEDERELKIKDYIRSHEGCGPEEVFRALGPSMARQTFYRRLNNLKDKQEVISEFKNKRDQQLYLNGQNPLEIVSHNLITFEKRFFQLLGKVINELEKPYSSIKERADMWEEQRNEVKLPAGSIHLDLFTFTILVFHHSVTHWLFDISFSLPEKVNDPQILERINGVVLTRVSAMYSKLFKIISSITDEKHLKVKFNKKFLKDTKEYVYRELDGLFAKAFGENEPTETFEFFDLEKESAELYNFKLI